MTKKEDNTQLAKIFLGVYLDCMTYKEKHPQKNITCDQFKDIVNFLLKDD